MRKKENIIKRKRILVVDDEPILRKTNFSVYHSCSLDKSSIIVCHQMIHYEKEIQNHSFHILPLKALDYYEESRLNS
jgi:hypothetical protein